jgi:hypothetical protein
MKPLSNVAATLEAIAHQTTHHVGLLRGEVSEVIDQLIVPTWDESGYAHHFPRALYGFVV